MASDKAKGTTFCGPAGQVAVRMGPAVAVGQYFVIDADNGGYYVNDDNQVGDIEGWWTELTPSPSDSANWPTQPAPAAETAPPTPEAPAPAPDAAPAAPAPFDAHNPPAPEPAKATAKKADAAK